MALPGRIRGQAITLKQLSEDQFEMYHKMLSSKIREILHLPPATLDKTVAFLSDRLKKLNEGSLLFYTIFDNNDGKLIGSIAIREPKENPGQLGAWLNENYWGGGRYQEALKLATQAYFDWKNVDAVNAHVETTNKRSVRAHKKFGFEIVDTLEKNGKTNYNMVLARHPKCFAKKDSKAQ